MCGLGGGFVCVFVICVCFVLFVVCCFVVVLCVCGVFLPPLYSVSL